jgi:enamine deaminase RidA (YjgF/YER057c/UK114 family)
MSRPTQPVASPARQIAAAKGHWEWPEGTGVHALRIGKYIYVGGQVSLAPDGEVRNDGDIESQTENVFTDLVALLQSAGSGMSDLVKLHTYYVFKGDGRDVTRYWERMTAVRLKYLANPGPAATAVRVDGAPSPALLIAVDGVAVINDGKQRIMPKHTWDWSIPTPFSQGWKIEDKIFVGGQISADMQGKALAPGDVVAQTKNVLELIKHVLADGGAGWSELITLRICYKHNEASEEPGGLYRKICDVIQETIPEPHPIVTAFGADLLYEGLLLEIDGIASLRKPKSRLAFVGTTTGPFPEAWQVGEEVFFSVAPVAGAGLEDQLVNVVDRIRSMLEKAGDSFAEVVKLTVFYVDKSAEADAQQIRSRIRTVFPQSVVTFVLVSSLPGLRQLIHVDGVSISRS